MYAFWILARKLMAASVVQAIARATVSGQSKIELSTDTTLELTNKKLFQIHAYIRSFNFQCE